MGIPILPYEGASSPIHYSSIHTIPPFFPDNPCQLCPNPSHYIPFPSSLLMAPFVSSSHFQPQFVSCCFLGLEMLLTSRFTNQLHLFQILHYHPDFTYLYVPELLSFCHAIQVTSALSICGSCTDFAKNCFQIMQSSVQTYPHS